MAPKFSQRGAALALAGLFLLACIVAGYRDRARAAAQLSEAVVYVKAASVNINGQTLILYDAARSGGGSVSNRTFIIPRDALGPPEHINVLIMTDARIVLGAPDAERLTLYGGAVAQQSVTPGP